MPTLEGVLELVRDAREQVECGRVNNAAWLLEAVEDDPQRVLRDAPDCRIALRPTDFLTFPGH